MLLPPTVSVIIPTYNYGHFVGRAIESVLGQSHRDIEVVVVDDGSTDGTVDQLARFGDDIQVISQQNRGVAAARNVGVATSTGNFLAFLDADDFWSKDKVERQVDRYRREPDVGLVHGGVQEVDPEGLPLGPRRDGMSGWVAEQMLLLRKPVVLAAPSNALIPRRFFQEVGGFDVELSTAADWDLCFRIAVEHSFAFVAETLVYYTIHTSNMSRNVELTDHDMQRAFGKIFTSDPPTFKHLERQAYANLQMMLSGSYYGAGSTAKAVLAGARSLMLDPRMALRLARVPLRHMTHSRAKRRSAS